MNSSVSLNMPTICIPRVFPNIDEKRIRRIFGDLNIGNIKAVDFASRQAANGDKYNLVYVHFNEWYRNENADIVRTKLLTGKEVKIIYDDPWFWKVTGLKEHTTVVIPEEQKNYKKVTKRATIQFDEDDVKYPDEKYNYYESRPRYEDPRQQRYEDPRQRYEDPRQRPYDYYESRPRHEDTRQQRYEDPRPRPAIRRRDDDNCEQKRPNQEQIRPLKIAPRLGEVTPPITEQKQVLAPAFIPRQLQMRNIEKKKEKKDLEPKTQANSQPLPSTRQENKVLPKQRKIKASLKKIAEDQKTEDQITREDQITEEEKEEGEL